MRPGPAETGMHETEGHIGTRSLNATEQPLCALRALREILSSQSLLPIFWKNEEEFTQSPRRAQSIDRSGVGEEWCADWAGGNSNSRDRSAYRNMICERYKATFASSA